ncbi:uncharacterized protein LOC118644248 [Monomorium pharaonis]|uniref:uncharacterized protein LOC118644248 n=1 Tax=Monomorium pharaonis TaxID=307658 RepID=UPI00174625E3|nr:uncharacterized protein LOC118644248 [Monomorium pharaonis]
MSSSFIPTTARICSIHFKEESFNRTCSITRLRPNALPSRSSSESTVEQFINENVETVSQEINYSPIVPTESIDVINGSLSPITNICSPQSVSKVDKTTMVSPTRVYNSPEKSRLRKRIKFLEIQHAKKMRFAQQKIRRYKNQVITLKEILNKLKNNQLLNETQIDIIHMLGKPIGEIFKRLIMRKKNACVPKQYSPEIRSFALTLHYYSARAYEYVRDYFNKCLPHVKTLSSWYRSVNGEPGISSEALYSITERVKKSNYTLFGSLLFDEMAIREHLEYDGSKFSGYIDLGENIACDDTILANQVLVFMIVCINGAWKIPISYYLIKGMSKVNNFIIQ